ncbi:hypothetical protein RND81_03G220500 [Saponaria officinalis]
MEKTVHPLKAICDRKVLDPHGHFLQKWNKIVLVLCAFTIAWDALFFYIPVVDGKNNCLQTDYSLEFVASAVRTLADLFYVGHIILQFHTGYVSPDSRGFGRGNVVDNLDDIAKRYMRLYFIVDVLAVLPFPQMAVLIPRLGVHRSTSKDLLTLVIFTQYIPRLFRVYPLYKEVMRTSGVVTGRAWAGAVLNLLLYLFASHMIGAAWYLFSIDRLSNCWHESCIGRGCLHLHASIYCTQSRVNDYTFNKTYCSFVDPDQVKSLMVYDFGMFNEALQSEVVQSRTFSKKISLCFWWGLRSLSSFGQNFKTSNCVGENLFSAFICLAGLILFSFLFGNIQKYVDSATAKAEEMRLRRYNTEKWMSHRSLPDDLRKKIRRYEEYKWQETRGVDEETVISKLPKDLGTDIKLHLWRLCFNEILKVPWFENLNTEILDELCEWLKPILYMEESLILRRGGPVKEVVFILRGSLNTSTYDPSCGFITVELNAGGYFGIELLNWTADPNNNESPDFPKSDWTVKSKTVVEALMLKRDDLKLVMKQLRILHGPKFQYIFAFYSEQCKTWGACRIQAEWRRHKKQKAVRPVTETPQDVAVVVEGTSSLADQPRNYTSRFAATVLQNLRLNSPRHSGISQTAVTSQLASDGA